MASATGQAVFAIVAKDAASKVLGSVGKSFGSLKKGGMAALSSIASASLAAATALAGFALAAIKAAADDERSQIRLNASLKARGILTDGLNAKIDEQIKSMAALGVTDDQVRAGIEVGSRFFKDQATLLKANSVAADIAAVTGQDLSEVMMTLGKGALGSTKGLKALGIEVKKGATIQDILTAATAKYGGTAAEIANSASGKFAAAQVSLNEAFEKLGYRFLPQVTALLDKFATDILPVVVQILGYMGDAIDDLIKNYISPLVTSVNEMLSAFGTDGVSVLKTFIDVALLPLKLLLTSIKAVIDGIVEGMRLIGMLGKSSTGAQLGANARTSYLSGGNLGVTTPGLSPTATGNSTYLQTNIDFSIGTKAQNDLVSSTLRRNPSYLRTP